MENKTYKCLVELPNVGGWVLKIGSELKHAVENNIPGTWTINGEKYETHQIQIIREFPENPPLEQRLLNACIQYVYDMCCGDSGTVEHFMEITRCTEHELMSMFYILGEIHGIMLDDVDSE